MTEDTRSDDDKLRRGGRRFYFPLFVASVLFSTLMLWSFYLVWTTLSFGRLPSWNVYYGILAFLFLVGVVLPSAIAVSAAAIAGRFILVWSMGIFMVSAAGCTWLAFVLLTGEIFGIGSVSCILLGAGWSAIAWKVANFWMNRRSTNGGAGSRTSENRK